ncbi:hypothetical protein L6164_007173 [Bauhinia variegata]|uniref:Uncharacterized protein n=1 Tax=Bauhinia variegata TaxID=167791 RepID=A0ACB9PWP2_BAUVA|nr:hypothetical protein L6164_007173 [Bauhinia variegata]
MADHEDEDLQMAIRMSMQHSPPEPKRSKPRDAVSGLVSGSPDESPESKSRRLQRELMAAAAEKRMMATQSVLPPTKDKGGKSGEVARKEQLRLENVNVSKELSLEEANELFMVVFGSEVSKDILAQWSNQGIRYLRLNCLALHFPYIIALSFDF